MAVKNKLDFPMTSFSEGTNYELYRIMMVRYVAVDGKKKWRFRCWAPNAQAVSIVGDFNGWDITADPMSPIGCGIWEGYIGGLKRFDIYKFNVRGVDGINRMKSDPFSIHTETPPATGSKIFELSGYQWNDAPYLASRASKNVYTSPINIYEVHLGSWLWHDDGNPLSYTDLADKLIPYVKEMNYTHIELMPITEHPLAASWGYQVGFMYAPTSRFGMPQDFMYFIDRCHQAGIGVLLDFVVSHFPKDAFGLYEFDGSPQYEYGDVTKQEHKGWGTRVYDYGKPEVQSFLISAVCFWLETYHIDGIRLDAVASMLYLDYDRQPDEWHANIYGGNYNLEAIEFIKKLNTAVLTKFPHTIMIAEESTAFPMVTMPPSVGGLGFNFKWNMGWMNDTLEYEAIDPFFRKGAHSKLTFSLTYAFSENYILPFSHDEVVHGKASMIGKMQGSYDDRFSALKALYVFQIMHPGKKLTFMGNEFGQFIEWDYKNQLDWLLLNYEKHKKLQLFVKELNAIYINESALYSEDDRYDGFKWIIVDDNTQNIIAFYREGVNLERVLAIISFSDVPRENYCMGVPDSGAYDVILNSSLPVYGGKSKQPNKVKTEATPMHGFKQSISINLDGNSALLFKLSKEDTKC